MAEHIEAATGIEPRNQPRWKSISTDYRLILFTDGEVREAEEARTGQVKTVRHGVSKKQAERVREQKGLLSRSELLRRQVRHFVDGLVISSRTFVDEVHGLTRERFGPNRKSGARKIRGTSEEKVWSLRDLHDGVDAGGPAT